MPRTPNRLDLPIELEREVFEIAAKADIGTALRLALVARRVQAWIEPIIYSCVVVAHVFEVGGEPTFNARQILTARRMARGRKLSRAPHPRVHRFIRTIAHRPASFFARHVQRLHVGSLTEHELVTVLTTCTGISELGWWEGTITPPVANALHALDLRRLSVDHSFGFGAPGMPQFPALTHLDLSFPDVHAPLIPPLESFTALTHFSAAYTIWRPAPAVFDDVFKARPLLQVLLVLSDRLYYDQISGIVPRHVDPRVVVMLPPVGNWSARWVHDMWPLAEELVRERHTRAAAEKAANAAFIADSE